MSSIDIREQSFPVSFGTSKHVFPLRDTKTMVIFMVVHFNMRYVRLRICGTYAMSSEIGA